MTIPEKINVYLRRSYEIEYTMFKEIVFHNPIKVYELTKIRRYLKSINARYSNIIVK